MSATIAVRDFEIYPGGSTAAVVGEDGSVTQLLEEVLNRHRYQVVRHHSPDELLGGLREAQEAAAPPANRIPSPVLGANAAATRTGGRDMPSLYIFNFQFQHRGRSSRRSTGPWWDALAELSKQAPRTAILVVIGPRDARDLIRRALEAGADEILRTDDAEIEELLWARVQSALAKAERAPRDTPTVVRVNLNTAPGGVERRRGERRRGERRGGGVERTSSAPAGGWAGDVVEEWEEPAAPEEIRTAHERVRAALAQLPSREERAGPLADLLGVSVPALRAESGRLDAKKIAEHLGISLASLARIASVSRQALNEKPDSSRVQAALDPLARILFVLETVLPPEHVRAWLNASHGRLGGKTPLHLILNGQAERVARMLERARDGGVD